jgi:hypothetical protein
MQKIPTEGQGESTRKRSRHLNFQNPSFERPTTIFV